ncbi:helix-turn-helix domain-containing protein [Propionibacterium freudenreichii]|uniref:helix-turn-helix domain-containing protein n=1 Tax=Propionibacterium freudenreichii TaxID=1744 RepID=UPI0005A5C5B3|nr:helix-turn-helix transcriptional regulator [Propionibacterium freudenreichii]CEI30257.1 Transcriptionnal regulator [Propionibacterium freudenreichii]
MDKQQRRAKLGDLLASMRLAAGLNQADVAARLGKPQSFVSKYESAERRVDLSDLEEIATAIGVSLEDVVAQYREAVDAG